MNAPASRVAVVAVNYNNAKEIAAFLTELKRHHPVTAVLVVDDGSTDGSDAKAEALGFTVIRHSRNRGVGASIRTGIQEARRRGTFDAVAVMSCNGKMKPAELPTVIAPILDGSADYVQGNRYRAAHPARQPLFRRITGPLFSWAASLILGRRFTDITCGFRAYRLSLLDDPALNLDQPWLDRYEFEYYVHIWACRSGAVIREVPVTIEYAHLAFRRRSKIVPFTGWWSMMRAFVLVRRWPTK
jgi:dolichol-phosphate mannosyltransferase